MTTSLVALGAAVSQCIYMANLRIYFTALIKLCLSLRTNKNSNPVSIVDQLIEILSSTDVCFLFGIEIIRYMKHSSKYFPYLILPNMKTGIIKYINCEKKYEQLREFN